MTSWQAFWTGIGVAFVAIAYVVSYDEFKANADTMRAVAAVPAAPGTKTKK